jgi:DNA-binding transcriptional ArsR family regulator
MEISKNLGRQHLLAFVLIFLMGILLAVINAHHAQMGFGTFFTPLFAASFISFVIGVTATLLFEWKIEEMKVEKIARVLPADERKVVKVLIEKTSMAQQDIVHLTGLSKLKVSRVVKRLEERGVVKKEPYGRTNLISLEI